VQSITAPSSNNVPPQSAPTLQLHDIHLPEQVNEYPIAIGWWLLALLILITIFALIRKTRKYISINKNKKLALFQLNNNKEMTCSDTITLLKWVTIQYFERNETAKLYGNNFQQFLLQKLPKKHHIKFTELTTAGFNKQYNKDHANNVDKSFNLGVILWITYALPIKKIKAKATTNTKSDIKQ